MATSTALDTARDGTQDPGVPTVGQYLIDRLHAAGTPTHLRDPGRLRAHALQDDRSQPDRAPSGSRARTMPGSPPTLMRVSGLGCVCVTVLRGGLSLCNSIAGAYAEKSPVIVLSGSPGLLGSVHNPLLHHKVKGFETAVRGLREDHSRLGRALDPITAFGEIDRVLEAAVRYKRPVYLEIPRDMVLAKQVAPHRPPAGLSRRSDPDALREALDETVAMLKAAKRP